MNSTTKPICKRMLASLACASLLIGQVAPVFAAPSQIPLVNRPENTPHPNFMLTLDDSGSMTYQYLPERSFIVNGSTVQFPSDGRVFVHPDEIRSNIFTTSPIAGQDSGRDSTFVMASLIETDFDADTKKLYQLQMRSPQVNRIYYNPALKYSPWAHADGTPYPNASKKLANMDPNALDPSTVATASSKTVDLTTISKGYKIIWYCGPNDVFRCNTDTQGAKSFNPAIYYILADNANPNTDTVGNNNYRLYNLNDGSTSAVEFSKPYAKRTDCTVTATGTSCPREAEWTNFANWFVYYRSRLLIAKASIPEAFINLGKNIRLGWGTIHQGITFDQNKTPSDELSGNATYPVDGATSKIVQQGVRDLGADQKSKFTQWVRKLKTYAGTPSKDAIFEVGQYFKRSDTKSPWSTDMVNGTPLANHLQCRRAFNILVTDGYYLASNTSLENIDNIATTPAGSATNTYTPQYPFMDSAPNTLADFAMEFWKNDLQDTIQDKVKPTAATPTGSSATEKTIAAIKSDPATWQHLTQFMVGFGVTGTLTRSDETLDQLINCGKVGGICWPTNPVNEIDDLWHAAINSRGEYFDVNTPDDLKIAIQSAVSRGAPTILKEAGIATAASTLITNNIKFVPEYTPTSWTGEIRAFPLDQYGKVGSTVVWTASTLVPAPEGRHIHVWDGQTKSAYAFNASNVFNNTRTKNLLSRGSTEAELTNLVNALRGAVVPVADYRERSGSLPDFVNSTPLFIKEGADLGYGKLPAEQGGGLYKTYRDRKTGAAPATDTQRRTGSALIIGGNGGMLHAFNAATGVERFAFIPEASLPNLSKITKRNYGSSDNPHQYFVDGPLMETDVYVTTETASAWTNVVYGTMGAGGKSIFALKLDMVDPGNLDANSPLWETTASQSDDIGYMTSEPQVGVLPNGQWKVFVGNGVDSTSGKAALLVIDAMSGAVESVAAYAPPAPIVEGTRSGLGGVRLVKNSLEQVVAAYAGDINGNLWRFEYDKDSHGMKVGYGGSPLFRAFGPTGATQPILAAPLVAAVSAPNQAQLVIFGTGRLLYESDSDDTSIQTVYGVLDKVAADQSTALAVNDFALTSTDRNLLVRQNITTLSSVTQLSTTATATDKSKTFIDILTQDGTEARTQGWLLDLAVPQSSAANSAKNYPKAIYPIQAYGKSVLITTVKPAASAESCDSTSGMGYAFFLNALTGNKNTFPSIDANGNGRLETTDGSYGGWIFEGGPQTIIKPASTTESPEVGCPRIASVQSTDDNTSVGDPCPPTRKPIKDRIWRQLFNPPSPAAPVAP